ncbi:hypothetical protein [Lamprobacter sp.]|uniref:hypothetical protein n=1 Tax=Lamprobacter sp. TaxID=3100796 RepID=UPI002B25BDF0|nr:hypothetical protein [Lamprobacter sp.]
MRLSKPACAAESIRLEDVKEALDRGKDATLEERRQPEGRLIDDTLAEMEGSAEICC